MFSSFNDRKIIKKKEEKVNIRSGGGRCEVVVAVTSASCDAMAEETNILRFASARPRPPPRPRRGRCGNYLPRPTIWE